MLAPPTTNEYVLYGFYVVLLALVLVAAWLGLLDKASAAIIFVAIVGNATGINVLPPSIAKVLGNSPSTVVKAESVTASPLVENKE